MATTISSGRASSPKLTANIADHGTIYGGRGLVFDGVTDYLTGTIGEEYASLENFSVSVWTTVDTASDWRRVFTLSSGNVRFGIKSTGKMTFYPNSSTSDINFTGTALSTTGGWYHHVVTFEKATTTIKHYLNGALDYTKTDITDTALDASGTYVVGSFTGSSLFWDGKISDLKLFDATLTEAQAQELYLKPEQSAPLAVRDNIFLWLPMCEGSPDSPQSIVYDHSEKKLGSELVTNGSFDTDSGWTKGDGWTIADGVASSDETAQSTHSYLVQSVSFKSGALYRVSYDLVYNDSAGNGFQVQFLGSGTSAGTGRTSSGSYVEYITAIAAHTTFNIRSSDGTATGTIDNISVKEVLMGNHATTNFFGDELLTATNWTTNDGWGLSTGTLTYNDSSNGGTILSASDMTNSGLETGKTYQLKYTIGALSSGTASIRIDDSSGNNLIAEASEANGAYTKTFTASSTNNGLGFRFTGLTTSGSSFTVTSYSLKEVGVSSSGFAIADSEPTIPQVPLLRYNEKMVFDGVDNVVPLSTNDLSSDMTICAWVSTETKASTQFIAGKWGSSNGWYIRLLTSGYLKFTINSSGINATGTTDLSDGKVHHIACVYDAGTSAKVYVDGVLQATTTSSVPGNLSNTAQALRVGLESNNANPFKGIIDEVSEWNTALSETEIMSLFNDGIALDATTHSKADTNLLGYWRNDGISSWADRNDIQAINFDGTDDYIVTGSNVGISGSNAYSMNCWFNLNAYGSYPVLMGSGAITGYNENSLLIRTDNNTVGWGNQIGANDFANPDGATISLNTWYMATFTFNGSDTIKIYINGVLDGTNSVSSINITNSVLYIGKRSNGLFLNGQMSQCAVYSSELSADDILGIYNLGRKNADLSVSYPTNLTGYWLLNPIHSSPDVTGSNGIEDRSTNSNHGTQNGGVSFLGANDGTPAGTPESIIVREGLNSNKDGLGFPFKNDDRDVLRLSENASEYIQIDDSDVFTFGNSSGDSPFSIETWVKMEDATSFPIISKGFYNTDFEWLLWTYSDDKLRFALGDESVSNCYIGRGYNTALTSLEGTWIHIVATYNASGASSGVKLYLNGDSTAVDDINDQSNEGSYVSMENLASPVYIGKYGTTYAKGLIDEVRIYNKVLSSTEISKNYKHGKGKHKN